ncbi:MAG: PEP/pyruvate-binding domain-containing protein [Bdellovibrionia bacterium]
MINTDKEVRAIIGERLTLAAFSQLSGVLGGYPFVKLIVDRGDRDKPVIHFINHRRYQFHSDYLAENLQNITIEEQNDNIDSFNYSAYLDPDRRFYLGVLALHHRGDRFFTLETAEIDAMDAEMIQFFYKFVKDSVDPAVPLLFKPANHFQEALTLAIDPTEIPRVFSHELSSSAEYIALNSGTARGRIRMFRTQEEYGRELKTIEWFDILVMSRVSDDIPRVSGIINANYTTPLSHTNVLASGWQIPNAIQIGIFEMIENKVLNNQWVSYQVDPMASSVLLAPIDRPIEMNQPPAWSVQRIKLEEPETVNTPIVPLDRLRMSDRYRYGTKAANLGELRYILEKGSSRLLGFYQIRRPPRANLLSHLAKALKLPESVGSDAISRAAWDFLRYTLQIPRGIALPFSVQQEFLESSPRIQQAIGKLKMALELNAREIDSLCLNIQALIRSSRMPESLRGMIDTQIAHHMGGVSSFVVRSSSNAEDLENFSAAGIYESMNHVTTAENIFQSIKEVWASLLSPRSVRLRHEVGISLDDCYMGVIVQEEIREVMNSCSQSESGSPYRGYLALSPTSSSSSGAPQDAYQTTSDKKALAAKPQNGKSSQMGGVLVTTNPGNRSGDFRNVYINVSTNSVLKIVQGSELPHQFLFNTVEGGGQTLSLGKDQKDLTGQQKDLLQKLALAGRLLQSHFSPDYTFSSPIDIEWLATSEGLFILQLRPYAR